MLRLLSGRAHRVTTAVSLVAPGSAPDTRSHTTEVYFRALEETEIQEYVAGGEPMDKAGAYAVQGQGSRLIAHIDGCYTNVVGLPIETTRQLLQRWGLL